VGMLNDQMITLNLIIVGASIAGMLTAVVTFRPTDVSTPLDVAVILIAVGAFMDAFSSNLTRPSSLYLSQALIGFASLLFLAQASVIGFARTLLAGGKQFVSFVVLFAMSQSVGGLTGTALLGTFQTVREKIHSHELVQSIVVSDPLVVARLQADAAQLNALVTDPTLRAATGAGTLAQQVAREANILAYNDVFLLVGVLASLAILWGIWIRWSIWRHGEASPIVLLQKRLQEAAAAQARASTAEGP
jgi:hypothetical protein